MGWVVSFRRPSSQKYALQGPWEPVMARGAWEHQDTGPQASVESLPVDLLKEEPREKLLGVCLRSWGGDN